MRSWKNWQLVAGPYDDVRAVRERALELAIEFMAHNRSSFNSRELAKKYADFILKGAVQ